MMGYLTVAENRAGRWVRVGSGSGAYRAFVPHPLPPALEWSPELISALSAADQFARWILTQVGGRRYRRVYQASELFSLLEAPAVEELTFLTENVNSEAPN
ncbi:MAG: hypothetical protein SNJ72_09965 [Fimbriimonadales bacterium]